MQPGPPLSLQVREAYPSPPLSVLSYSYSPSHTTLTLSLALSLTHALTRPQPASDDASSPRRSPPGPLRVFFRSRGHRWARIIVGLRAQAARGITSPTEEVPTRSRRRRRGRRRGGGGRKRRRRGRGCSEYSKLTLRNKQGDTLFGRRLWREATGICN